MVLEKTDFSNICFKDEANILKALGHPVRLKILYALLSESCNVKNMQECVTVPQATLSQHLSVLKNVGAIEGEREGNQMIYKIVSPLVLEILGILDNKKQSKCK